MAATWTYEIDTNVQWGPFINTDMDFFAERKDGVIVYDLFRKVINKYAMVHLDGPHSVEAVSHEITWFNYARMGDSGAYNLRCMSITPDFIRIEPIQELFRSS